MKIENVRWGLKGEPYGQPCLYFNIDKRPASCFWEQKKGIVDRGYLYVDFEDRKPSHLTETEIRDEKTNTVLTSSNKFIHSPWLRDRLREMVDSGDNLVEGFLIGDAPEEKP